MKTITLKAKVEGTTIQIYAVGKWRAIRYYGGRSAVPSKPIQKEICHRAWLNLGSPKGARVELDWS